MAGLAGNFPALGCLRAASIASTCVTRDEFYASCDWRIRLIACIFVLKHKFYACSVSIHQKLTLVYSMQIMSLHAAVHGVQSKLLN